MGRFINRENELNALNEQYASKNASFVVVYGRRRIGKTTLIKEFIKDKKALYFLADNESQPNSIKRFAQTLADYTGQEYISKMNFENWRELFKLFCDFECEEKKILIIDELPYMITANKAFPSILQWVWDEWLAHQKVMLILCGSLVSMMIDHTLSYSSPLYGRRTGQIKLKQIDFTHYNKFFNNMPYKDMVEHYSVTGGVPKYIELFDAKSNLFDEINRLILSTNGLLYAEPEFLLLREVDEIGSYFSVLKSIATGNHRAGKISADIGIKETSLPKYLKTLIDLDILRREVPVTENNPERSKISLYQINDNFLRFWFRFVYQERDRLELGQNNYVLNKIKANFIDNHVAHIYENVCCSELWKLSESGKVQFDKLGRWWNRTDEVDIVAIDTAGNDIIFAECKFRAKPADTDVFYNLLRKKNLVDWNAKTRRETFVIFSINGFTVKMIELSKERSDILLVGENGN